MEDKKGFVAKVSEAVAYGVPNVEKVDYERYEHNSNGWKKEFVVVYYKGGSISVRSVNGTSCGAIFQEIGKLLFEGYYEEMEYRERLINSLGWTRVQ